MVATAQRRRRILFVGEAVTLAHVGRPLVLAGALDPERFDVHFACGARYRGLVESAGLPWHPLPTMDGGTFLSRLESGSPLYDRATLGEYVRAEGELLSALRPDMVVGDFRVSLGISCELAGVPYANLCNAHWSPYSTQRFPTPEILAARMVGRTLAGMICRAVAPLAFRYHAAGYNALRRAHGLAPVAGLREMYTGGTWTLYSDIPTIAPTAALPDHHRYLGPVNWSPEVPLPAWWERILGERPIVYVTLGSSGDLRVLRSLLAALDGLPVNVALATAGRAKDLALPANVYSADYLPGTRVLGQASACVFNGGAATGYQALSAGVPVLGLASNPDQLYHMESVERAGAGRLLRASQASPRRLASMLRELLENPERRDSAQRLRREIDALEPRAEFRRFMDSVFPPAASQQGERESAMDTRPPMKRMSITEHLQAIERGTGVQDAAGSATNSGHFELCEGRYRLRVANDLESRRRAYELVYRLYLEKEYASPNHSKMWLSVFDALPGTTTLLVERTIDGRAVGALTVVGDSACGLPADTLYKDELDALRASERRMAEIISLGVDDEAQHGAQVLLKLFNFAYFVSRGLKHATDFVITVNPRHVRFYERLMLFSRAGEERDYGKVGGAPAVLLRLDFAVAEAQRTPGRTEAAGRSLYAQFRSVDEEPHTVAALAPEVRPMSREELVHFMIEKTNIFADASPEHRAHIASTYYACSSHDRELCR